VYFYVCVKSFEGGDLIFASGTGEEGEDFFPFLNLLKPFSKPLNLFYGRDFEGNKVYISKNFDLRIIKERRGDTNVYILKIPQRNYGRTDRIYFWIGMLDSLSNLLFSVPDDKEDSYPLFCLLVDQDEDSVWDRGISVRATVRIVEDDKKEEDFLFLSKVKKFFNPDVEPFVIEFSSLSRENLKAFVYSLTGKKLKALSILWSGDRARIIWEGRDNAGNLVKPGVYLVVIKTGEGVKTQIPIILFRSER
jgi:hypothetical protein